MSDGTPVEELVSEPQPAIPLFSQEQFEAYAEKLASSHLHASDSSHPRPLLNRLEKSAAQLEEAYQFLSAVSRSDPQTVASEDWLRDNYHVVQDQIREIQQDLPRKYYVELPRLAS